MFSVKLKSMNKIFVLVAALLVFGAKGFAQEVAKDAATEVQTFKTYVEVTTKPYFPGGIGKFYKFVGENFKIPRGGYSSGGGKIAVQFIIEKDGSLSNFEVISNTVGGDSSREITRVLKQCPGWIPGSENGEAVRVLYAVPITVRSKSN